ncbi:ribosomal RNA small subunit methyltransferase A [Candidatus Micrarchaeota archaeon]|nr:ribosomal RNA small subunit methyltransferase A [Candidatus Micrarchaeota archaeon]
MPKPARFGQHFLVDRPTLEAISSFLDLHEKTVLEIGAGTGNLTEALAKQAKKVVAIEISPSLVKKLHERFMERKNVQILECDALEFNFEGFKLIFGNLPYNISSKLLFRIIESNFEEAVLCLQKEVAERLVASPNSSEYSRLTAMVQSRCDVSIVRTVSRECFRPIPGVDSAIVYLKKDKKFDLNGRLIAAIFQHKNQSLKNALIHSTKALGMSKEELLEWVEPTGLKGRRVRTLSLAELQEISDEYRKLKAHSS